MNKKLQELRKERKQYARINLARLLHYMKTLSPTKVQVTQKDWEEINKELEEYRKMTSSGGYIAEMLHYMKSLEEKPPEERPQPPLPPLRKF